MQKFVFRSSIYKYIDLHFIKGGLSCKLFSGEVGIKMDKLSFLWSNNKNFIFDSISIRLFYDSFGAFSDTDVCVFVYTVIPNAKITERTTERTTVDTPPLGP